MKPEWWTRYENPVIRQYIVDLCKSYAPGNPRIQERLYYVGWEWIGRCHPGKTPEYYMHMGYVGITRYYKIYIRRISHIPFTWTATHRRVRRKTKKYFKKVSKKC